MESRQALHGFTLIEVLTVLAIIASIAAVIGYYSFVWIQTSRLKEAAQQVIVDLQRARSQAQLTSEDSRVALCSPITTACNPTSASQTYVTSWGAGGTGAMSGLKTLPYGVTIQSTVGTAGSGYISYTAPYAETSATGLVWQLNSPSSRVAPLFVRVVGVTGKVSLSATN